MSYKQMIPLHEPLLNGNELSYLTECIESGWVSSRGPFVGKLETAFNSVLGGNSVSVANGTSGMFLALKTLGVKPDSEVIVPDTTFAATVNPVIHLGARPLFMDVEPVTFGLDPGKLSRFFQTNVIRRNGVNYNRDTGRALGAVVLVHLYGLPAQVAEIRKICDRQGVPLIEDCAEALGGTVDGKPLGTWGDAAVFSFNGNKTVTGGGGGLVNSRHPRVIEEIRKWADHYRDPEHHWLQRGAGYNFQISNLQAAVALAQFERLDQKIERKRQIHDIWDALCHDYPGIELIHEASHGSASYWLNILRIEEPDASEMVRTLLDRSIETRTVFMPLHRMPPYRKYAAYWLDVSEDLHRNHLCLPSSETLTNDDQEQVTQHIISEVNRHLAKEAVEHA